MNYYDKFKLEEKEEEGEQVQAIINDNNEFYVPEQLELDLEC